jgi:hypothetical protein
MRNINDFSHKTLSEPHATFLLYLEGCYTVNDGALCEKSFMFLITITTITFRVYFPYFRFKISEYLQLCCLTVCAKNTIKFSHKTLSEPHTNQRKGCISINSSVFLFCVCYDSVLCENLIVFRTNCHNLLH